MQSKNCLTRTGYPIPKPLFTIWPFRDHLALYGFNRTLSFLAFLEPLYLPPHTIISASSREEVIIFIKGKLLHLANPEERIETALILPEKVLIQLNKHSLRARRLAEPLDLLGTLAQDNLSDKVMTLEECNFLTLPWKLYYQEMRKILFERNLIFFIKELKQNFQLFYNMSLRRAKLIFHQVEPLSAMQDQYVIQQGDLSDILMFILRGDFTLQRNNVALLSLSAGQLYGMQQIMLEKPYIHSVVCTSSKGYFFTLPGKDLRQLLTMINRPQQIRTNLQQRIIYYNKLYRQKIRPTEEPKKNSSERSKRISSAPSSINPEMQQIFQYFKTSQQQKINHLKHRSKPDLSAHRYRISRSQIRRQESQCMHSPQPALVKLWNRVLKEQMKKEYSVGGRRDVGRGSNAIKNYKRLLRSSRGF